MIGDLDFVKIKERKKVSLGVELTPDQKKTWKIIKKGFEDLKMIEQRKMIITPARDFLQELQNEGCS
jgi:hypothetical protein